MNNKVYAIKNHEGLCWKCLKSYDKSNIKVINIPELGEGNSAFNGAGTKLQLCVICYEESMMDNPKIWNMDVNQIFENDIIINEEFLYESDMLNFIDTLPIESQQFVWNEYINGFYTKPLKMIPQDWIDYRLKILSHEQCKKYDLLSPDEIKAYNTKFPSCQHPINILCNDGSKGCMCPYGAYGSYNQIITNNDFSLECYDCKQYITRTTPIIDLTEDEFKEKYNYLFDI